MVSPPSELTSREDARSMARFVTASNGVSRRLGTVLSCASAPTSPTKKSASSATSRLKTGTTLPSFNRRDLAPMPFNVRIGSPTFKSRAITQPEPAFQNR